jgi:DNA invertase Pin-like site-specific DNA recombinase
MDGRQDVENQLDELRRFVVTQGWEIITEYVDHESGGHADRPEFLRMLEDAAQRRFDVLLFWVLDRLTREGALQTLQYLNRLSDHGVAFRPCGLGANPG